MTHDNLTGLYNGSWKGVMVDDAFSHPAKMGFNLAAWIYEHAIAEGWVKTGDRVIDPFGGVGGTAFHALRHGLIWTGVELEPKFVALGNQNIAAWQKRFGSMPNYGRGLLLQGDSRNLRSVLAKAGVGEVQCVASSPPYNEGLGHGGNPTRGDGRSDDASLDSMQSGYGETLGQLGAMRTGEAPAISVSSPPYAEIAAGAGGLNHKPAKHDGQQSGRAKGASQSADQRYGKSEGQLSAMPEGKVAGCVSSPPYEGSIHEGQASVNATSKNDPRNSSWNGWNREHKNEGGGYSPGNPDNIGNQSGDTFWSAARLIVQEVFALLKPGGVAIWVCGDFVRKGKRVLFCDQWQALCESAGFLPLCRHTAWKKSHHGTQRLLDGGEHVLTKTKVSFFRRLHAAKRPDLAVESEDVICVQKPLYGVNARSALP